MFNIFYIYHSHNFLLSIYYYKFIIVFYSLYIDWIEISHDKERISICQLLQVITLMIRRYRKEILSIVNSKQ